MRQHIIDLKINREDVEDPGDKVLTPIDSYNKFNYFFSLVNIGKTWLGRSLFKTGGWLQKYTHPSPHETNPGYAYCMGEERNGDRQFIFKTNRCPPLKNSCGRTIFPAKPQAPQDCRPYRACPSLSFPLLISVPNLFLSLLVSLVTYHTIFSIWHQTLMYSNHLLKFWA